MGAFFSKHKTDSDDYEKILSQLDSEIQQSEIKLSDIRIRDRRVGILWLLYSTVLWIVYIVYYLYALHGHYSSLEAQVLAVFPVVGGPFCIYYVRKAFRWAFSKQLSNLETRLVTLRKKQKLKVEELKKKTAYYSTKSLLERYDPSSEKKKELDEQRRKKMLEEQEKKKAMMKQQQQQQKYPLQQQQQQRQQGQIQAIGQPPVGPVLYQHPQPQQWYDKLVDALVGDVGPETKYALICNHCYAHNGLVLPQEVDTIQYTCPHCHQFNASRKSRQMHPDGPVLPTMSPTSEPDHDESAAASNNNNNNSTTSADSEKNLKDSTTTAIEEKEELRQRIIPSNEA